MRRLGFYEVGEDVRVSREARFHRISGYLGSAVRVDDYSVVTGHIDLGDGCHISPYVFLSGVGGSISFGSRTGIGSHSSVFTKSEPYGLEQRVHVREHLMGPVTVGEDSILGRSVTVMPGVTIGSNCAIGANCIISESIGDSVYLVSHSMRNLSRSRDSQSPKNPLS